MTAWKKPKLPTPPAPEQASEQGCPYDCGLCARHRQHTCTVLIEVTQRCNLACTYCFASAGGATAACDPGMGPITRQLQVARHTAGPCNVQLSGGEPTMRDDLPDIIRVAKSLFPFVQLNTNGLRIARERGYARALADAGLDSVFLQFDGTTNAVYTALRGAPLLRDKLRAVRTLGEAGIGVVLVPTVVPGVNDGQVGALLRMAAAFSPVVRGLHFQPVSHFGRVPDHAIPGRAASDPLVSEQHISERDHAAEPPHQARITLPELMRAMEEQTQGLVKADDFLPPGCEHALCSFHANYLVHADGRLQRLSVGRKSCSCEATPASEGADAAKSFVRRQWAAPQSMQEQPIPQALLDAEETVETSGTDACLCVPPVDAVLGQPVQDDLDAFLSRVATHVLAVSAMAFQDAWNLDLERLQGCCIHVSAPDGRLVPFCAWNCTAQDGTPLHRSGAGEE